MAQAPTIKCRNAGIDIKRSRKRPHRQSLTSKAILTRLDGVGGVSRELYIMTRRRQGTMQR